MSKPKHRNSKARGRKRRTHYKAETPTATKCGQCGQDKLPHRVCSSCGYYKGVQVKYIESLEERKERREKKTQTT